MEDKYLQKYIVGKSETIFANIFFVYRHTGHTDFLPFFKRKFFISMCCAAPKINIQFKS